MEIKYQVTSGKKKYTVAFTDQALTKGVIEGEDFNLDLIETSTGFHVIRKGKSYRVDVVSVVAETKTVVLCINHKQYEFQLKDRFDDLLQKMGMSAGAGNRISSIKAPMPGLVLDIMVKPGDEVTGDQPLIILEAMKMENVIKSPSEGVVKAVSVNKGSSVEKNQLLIEFT